MTAPSSSGSHPVMTAAEYYRHPSVRTRIREYCGATDGRPFTCAYVMALKDERGLPSWESAERHPPEDLPDLLEAGVDMSGSMWDTESLIFYLDLDYLNPDHPEEAFLHPADVFFQLEPVYRATRRGLHGFGIDELEIVTGRGHHFSGRIPWTHPVVFNGTEVGSGTKGRACVSIDFSHAGDPLGRTPAAAVRAAERQAVGLPDVAQGVATLLVDYLPSRLATFHRDYFAVTPHPPDAWSETYDRLDPKTLAPCVAWPLEQPNDLLLQPARLQNVTRGLMADGWHPRHIAGLVHSRYARDYGWGTRWSRQDAQTRAEFDVRVFAGLAAAGLDTAIDFNCVSAQEKGICPHDPHDPNCHRDLRLERVKLLEGTAPA